MSVSQRFEARPAVIRSPIRIASVPAGHPYVRHVSLGSALINRLPDPIPAGGTTAPGQWWPARMLEPEWVDEHHRDFDVFHLHFGFDALTAAQLRHLIDRLRHWRKPLVYTAHDLRNPHHAEPQAHSRLLDVLIPAADALITLTEGAAREIHRRWGRKATVLPHPHVVPAPMLGRPRRARRPKDRFTVGIHVKAGRPNVDAFPLVAAALAAVDRLPGARLQIDAREELFRPGNRGFDPALSRGLAELAERGALDLNVHGYYDDAALWQYLGGLDVSVLPYRFGTHSGWLEACHDLGTAVVAPSCGHYGQQQRVFSFVRDEDTFDPGSLVDAITAAHEAVRGGEIRPADRVQRLAERAGLEAEHHRIYAELHS